MEHSARRCHKRESRSRRETFESLSFVEREDGKDQSALIVRDLSIARPGTYNVRVSDGERMREVTWTVYDTGPRKAKNVILFIGDGLSAAHRTAARLLAKGIAEGKALVKLAIDDMPDMALVATCSTWRARVRGFMENTEVFRIMADALGLAERPARSGTDSPAEVDGSRPRP